MSMNFDSVDLRPIDLNDAASVFKWTGDPLVTKNLFWEHHKSIDETKIFIDQFAMKHGWFKIVTFHGEPVGSITLDKGLGKAVVRAELGYVLRRDLWGKGIITSAVLKALHKGFKDLNLHRIEAFVDPENIGSVRVLEKAGFIKNGYLPKYLTHRGVVRDRVLYGVVI